MCGVYNCIVLHDILIMKEAIKITWLQLPSSMVTGCRMQISLFRCVAIEVELITNSFKIVF